MRWHFFHSHGSPLLVFVIIIVIAMLIATRGSDRK